jgi:hypothetical protein
VAKFNEGTLVWQRRFFRTGQWTEAKSVLPTSDGGAFVSGSSTDSLGRMRGWLARLTTDGSVIWQRLYDHSFELSALAWSTSGDLLVGGSRPDNHANATSDILFARFDHIGNPRWAIGLDRYAWDGAYGVAASPDDSSVVFGYSISEGDRNGARHGRPERRSKRHRSLDAGIRRELRRSRMVGVVER